MDEAKLIERLLRIEALYAGAATLGEQVAAAAARERILARLRQLAVEDPPEEYQFTLADQWSRQVFVALLRRYGLEPYRYARQRYTTVMVRVSKRFVDETLWPEYLQISATLEEYLRATTDRVVQQVLQADSSEARVVDEPPRLPPPPAPPPAPAPPTKPPPPPPSTAPQTPPPASSAAERARRAREERKKKRKNRR